MKSIYLCILALCLAQSIYAAPANTFVNEIVAIDETLAEVRGILSFGKDFYNDLIAAPINHLAGSLASMLAQFTLGVIDNGIIVGKRSVITEDMPRGFFDDFSSSFINAIYPVADNWVQSGALALTQWLANFANGGKTRSSLLDLFSLDIATLQQMLDQIDPVLLSLAIQGNSRGLIDWMSNFGSSIKDQLYPHIDNLVQTGALALTQWLANFANGGNSRGLIDWMSNFGSSIKDQLYPHIDNLVQTGALALTQWLANFANGGNSRSLLGVILSQNTFDALEALLNQWFVVVNKDNARGISEWLYPQIDSLVQAGALALTQWLANYANGGKNRSYLINANIAEFEKNRGIKDYFSDFKDKLTATINSIAQSVAVPITNGLVHIMNNGLLPTIGKRDLSA